VIAHAKAACRVAGVVCVGLLPVCAYAKNPPPVFRVTSIEFQEGGRLDSAITQECDVAQVVTNAIQRSRVKNSKAPTTDLVLRIDRVAKLKGQLTPRPKAAATELGIFVLTAGSRELNQLFFCRAEGLTDATNAAHCARVGECGEKIAKQISTWLSWQAK